MTNGPAGVGGWRISAIFTALALLVASAAGAQPLTTSAHTAQAQLPPEDVLSVHIAVFDANIPEDPEIEDLEEVFTDIRAAESRYIPYHLRRTLEATGHWGDVRVVPGPVMSSELLITGRILESHGELLHLRVRVTDATGRQWLEREYEHEAGGSDYRIEAGNTADPFQPVYDRIADDLLDARSALTRDEKREIQEVAAVRFGAELIPEAYAVHLESDNGRTRLVSRPDTGDPLTRLLDEARLRELRMIDVLDFHYHNFYDQMAVSYTDWRQATQRELEDLRELRRQSRRRKALGIAAVIGGIFGATQSDSTLGDLASHGAIFGGAYAISSGIERGRQTSIHVEALRELSRSLEADVEPMVMEVRDRTVRLTGSAEEQYAEWRQLLSEIYALSAESQALVAPPAAVSDRGR